MLDGGPDLGVVNEIRKDFRNDQDTFEVIPDPFADRRSGFVFATNRERNFFVGKGGLMTVGEGFNDEMGY